MGTQLFLLKGAQPPIFGPYLLRPNGCMDQDVTWYGARPRPRRLCVRWGPRSPSPKGGRAPQIFGPCFLWRNGWMDEAGIWHGGSPQPRQLCVRWGSSPLAQKGAEPTPQFSAHFYRGQTAGCIKMPLSMDVGISPGDCVRWGPSALSPKRRQSPQFSAHVYCGQTAGWIKMALGTEVCLGPVHTALDGDTSPIPKKGDRAPPIFGPSLLYRYSNGWMHQDAT